MRTLARTAAAFAAVTLTAGVVAAAPASATRPLHPQAPNTTSVSDPAADVAMPDDVKPFLFETIDLTEVVYTADLDAKTPKLKIAYTVKNVLNTKKVRTQVTSDIGGALTVTSHPTGYLTITKVGDDSRVKCAGSSVKTDRSRTVITQTVPLACLTGAGLDEAFITSGSALDFKKDGVLATDDAATTATKVPFSSDILPTS